jgi:hypothetical protein
MKNTADVTGGKPMPILLQSISGVSAINPLVAFYDIHGGKREVLLFYYVPDTTRDNTIHIRVLYYYFIHHFYHFTFHCLILSDPTDKLLEQFCGTNYNCIIVNITYK